jgi:hypothetical protein
MINLSYADLIEKHALQLRNMSTGKIWCAHSAEWTFRVIFMELDLGDSHIMLTVTRVESFFR